MASGYRLAGTLAVGKDFIAFLEVPQGGQVLVRAGSVVGNAKVLAVTASSLKIALRSGVVELSLDGTAHPASATLPLRWSPSQTIRASHLPAADRR